MYCERLEIENFKGISKMELNFQPGVNLLIGDNGVGKTSVLDAVVVALGGYLNGVNGVSAKNILLSDIKMDTYNMGSSSTGIVYNVPVRIACQMQIDNERMSWERVREDETSKRKTRTIKQFGDITKYAQGLVNNLEAKLPILSYQSSLRASQTRRGDFGAAMKEKLADRRCGYLGCLDSVPDLKKVKEWCFEMERAAFIRGEKIKEYEQFREIVAAVMQQMNGLKMRPQIFYSRQYDDLVYSEKETVIPISQLSAGYQSVLWMVMDISYRLAILNPNQDDLRLSKGIVLIDEIDMHLHPKWQWNVLSTLQNQFPRVQFIIATHSPIIIASCKNGNLILIDDKQKVTYLADAYGYTVKDVLELCQGSTVVLTEIARNLEVFERELNKGNYVMAEKIISELTQKYGEKNTEIEKARVELELEKELASEDEADDVYSEAEARTATFG